MEVFDKTISKVKNLAGVDLIYFLNSDFQIVKEYKKTNCNSYLKEVTNIIKSGHLANSITKPLYSKPFHTYTLLNETGLMLISNLSSSDGLYMIIVAGENEPADLINLLKICKESRLSFSL